MADPTGLTVDTTDTGASLEWDAATLAGVTDYTIFRRTPPTGVPFVVGVDVPVAANVAGLTYDDAGLIPATAYEWQVFGRVPAVTGVAPTITSADNTSFTESSAGTFTVTATGTPAPTLSVTGSLPAGVTFTPATGVLAGTPSVSGSFPLTFTAANGTLPNATQSFTLTVAAAAWSPASLPGLVGWWDASDLASITAAAGRVSQWNSKVGSFHLVQPVGTLQPLSGSHTINTKNALYFAQARTDRMGPASNPLAGASAGSLLYVVKGSSGRPVSCGAPVCGPGGGDDCYYPYADATRYEFFGSSVRYNWSTSPANNPHFLNAHQVVIRAAAGAYDVWHNNTNEYTNATNTVAFGTNCSVGYGPTSGLCLEGDIAEIVMMNQAISPADRTAWNAYATSKWGTP